jgi:hypothetical protein
VAAGQSTTCAVLDNGTLQCWGQSPEGLAAGDDTIVDLEPRRITIQP